ncbi:MAG: MFS transporter [Chlamydiae bacterium SM23_39]|nr:MAG: MFS transporter [Chlamydiae bacterium SM23_39]
MNFCLDVLKIIYSARFIDDKMDILVKQNKGTTFFLSVKGHEIIGAVSSLMLDKNRDWAFPYYRDRAFALGWGCPKEDILAAFLARDIKNHSGGRLMLDHFSDKKRKIPPQSSCVGSQFLQAVGVAKGIKLNKKNKVVYVSGGDGSTSQGDFHEALNFSCIHKLPVMFVIQDNGWAISTPSKEQTAGSIEKIARGYEGLNVYSSLGSDYEKLSANFKNAILDGRNYKPSIVIVRVPRLGPHTISDDPKKYKDEEILQREKREDPLLHFEKYLLNKGYTDEEKIAKMKEEIKKEVEKAADIAEKIAFPKAETARDFLFKDFEIEEKNTFLPKKVFMIEAINNCLKEEMKKDEKIVVFGQDVAGRKGGVFGVTKDLTEMFGKERCFNTPLAESTIVGIAIGLAFNNFKPIAEIQFSDFCWTGVNQLLNELSSVYYRSKGEWEVPVVIRMTCGGYVQGAVYHSQSIESIFIHIPGLKVAIPSNANDAKRLLKTSILDPNPVIFLEHKALYRREDFSKNEESSIDDFLPFGKGKIVLNGKDLTLVTWGLMVAEAYEVAKNLLDKGVSVELIDLRTLVPVDLDIILKSIKKTAKLLILHEANKTLGFGAEIAALISDKAFTYLDAPIKRIAGKDCFVPYCKILEEEILPSKRDIEKAILELVSF